MLRRVLLLLSSMLLLAACRPETVPLGYRLGEGSNLTYQLDADARATWDIGTSGSGGYSVRFDVLEQVVDSDASGSVVEVTMTPTRSEADGLPPPGPTPRSFTLKLAPSGEVLDILEVAGFAAESLEPDDLAFIGTYRPPLPADDVGPQDRWTAETELVAEELSQRVTTTGHLAGLRLAGGGERTARLNYESAGPLEWSTRLPQGVARLSGDASTETTAAFDIDAGSLRAARSRTVGDFDVVVTPELRGEDIVGSLTLEIRLRLMNTGGRELGN